MKPIYCAICGDLVAKIESGSKLGINSVMICGKCWGEPKRRDEPRHTGDMPDFLKQLFPRP